MTRTFCDVCKADMTDDLNWLGRAGHSKGDNDIEFKIVRLFRQDVRDLCYRCWLEKIKLGVAMLPSYEDE